MTVSPDEEYVVEAGAAGFKLLVRQTHRRYVLEVREVSFVMGGTHA